MVRLVDSRRYRKLASGRPTDGPVVYWMSRDQRINDNWALLYAQELALRLQKPLMVLFCLTPHFLGANFRHYSFLIKGLAEIQGKLADHNIPFSLLLGEPGREITHFFTKRKAAALVTDFDPLRIKKSWKERVFREISVNVYEVDAHNIIPCWLTSEKQEYAAYTIRPKIKRKLTEFLHEFQDIKFHPHGRLANRERMDIKKILQGVGDKSVKELDWILPGENAAQEALIKFVCNSLASYPENRNNPCLSGQSGLSPYLHFGQLSAQRVALKVQKADVPQESKETFLEELIVRRELADNFCYYNTAYDRFAGFPKWARKTLDEHRQDKRQFTYTMEQMERAETGEDLWNACQLDLCRRGKLHGYLRMYWAKKILEWTASPEEALQYAIYLNDKYSLDGRDPNGYTGIAWSIGGVHDRAWPERPVFGKIRYMNRNGCRRKFDVDRYIEMVRLSASSSA